MRWTPFSLLLLGFLAFVLLATPACDLPDDTFENPGDPADDDDDMAGDDDDTAGDDDVAGDDDDHDALTLDAWADGSLATVIRVEGTVGDADEVVVSCGVAGEPFERVARIDGERFETELAGLVTNTDYVVEATAYRDGEPSATASVDVTTGPTPLLLPGSTITHTGGAESADGFYVTTLSTDPFTNVMFDGEGRYRWWHAMAANEEAISVQAGVDGETLVSMIKTSHEYPPLDEPGAIVRLALDGTVVEEWTTDSGHHDFVQLDDGTVAWLEFDYRQVGAARVAGDRIMERTPDGAVREVWTVWDHAAPPETPEDYLDWSHANALAYDEVTQDYFIGLSNLDTIWRVDRQTGGVVWRLGGHESDFVTTSGDWDLFAHAHGFFVDGARVVVFDNGSPQAYESRVVEYLLEDDQHLVTLEREWFPEPAGYSFALGDLLELPGGGLLVAWGTLGVIEEFDPSGASVWELGFSIGGAVGYLDWMAELPVAD